MQLIVKVGHFGHFSFTLDLGCFFKTIFVDQQQQTVYVTRLKKTKISKFKLYCLHRLQ